MTLTAIASNVFTHRVFPRNLSSSLFLRTIPLSNNYCCSIPLYLLCVRSQPRNKKGKILAYLINVAAQGDVETQRKGMVVIVWFDASYTIPYRIPMREGAFKDYGAWSCLRLAALHICSPDTPAFRLRRSITALRAYSVRSRIKMHTGKAVELMYSLHGYGIPFENIPMTWTGKVKVSYLKNWIKLRKAMEDEEELQRLSRLLGGTDTPRTNTMANVVECPNSNDVVFRQGTAMNCHPGNAHFRSLVEASVIKLREGKSSAATSVSWAPPGRDAGGDEIDDFGEGFSTSKTISALISDLIHQIIDKDKGRVLVWTQNHGADKYGYGCWCTIENQEQIYSKVEYMVRENIRSFSGPIGGPSAADTPRRSLSTDAARSTAAAAATSTTTGSVATATAAAAATTTTTSTSTTTITRAESQRANLQSTESSTSISMNQSFSSGCSPSQPAVPADARPRDGLPFKRLKSSSSPPCDNDDNTHC